MVQILSVDTKDRKDCESGSVLFPKSRHLFICTLVLLVVIFVAIFCILYFTTYGAEEQPTSTPSHGHEPPLIADNETLTIVSRSEWLALPPQPPTTPLSLPVSNVVILHTASSSCNTRQQCTSVVRQIQDEHVKKRDYSDIAYSFLVGGDGNVYEGRGWYTKGAFAFQYNSISIGIAFIGTFSTVVPNQGQLQAGQRLIEEGVELGAISDDYKLLAHRQIRDTESPGAAFYELIKTWPHFEKNPDLTMPTS